MLLLNLPVTAPWTIHPHFRNYTQIIRVSLVWTAPRFGEVLRFDEVSQGGNSLLVHESLELRSGGERV